MVFSSTLFLFVFLPCTLLGYYILGKSKNYWLLLVSLLFFAWSQPHYVWIIVFNIVINYCGAMLLTHFEKHKKLILACTVALNLLVLFYFKYFDFTIQSLNRLTGLNISLYNIILPIGISFFTFQGMSYVVDVYREDVPVQKNIFMMGLYIVLFPQLIAGPIVRYKDVAEEINNRTVTLEDFSSGIERFIIGLAKKAVIANTMAVTVDAIWSNGPAGNSWSIAWLGSIAYSLQIYFDFSGYSDMAIGLGRMFGFHFIENFNLPYIAKSITEFWRRWHISLSTWFRDYVYIPLGGNRKHTYRNLGIVFLLTGIWHGANWQFIAWGLYHGFFILIERFLRKGSKPSAPSSKTKSMLMSLYTLVVVHFGWVLFRAPSIKWALIYILSMFNLINPEHMGFTLFWYLDRWTLCVLLAGIFFASCLPAKFAGLLKAHLPEKLFVILKYTALLCIFYVAMLRIVSGTYNPFIYFQF